MTRRSTVVAPVAAVSLLLAASNLDAAVPPSGTVAEDNPSVSWSGGPFAASNPNGCAGPSDPSCDNFVLEIVQPSFSPYVVVIEIDSTSLAPDRDDYDLAVFGPDGSLVDDSTSPGSFERVALWDAPPGIYRVEILPWLVTPGSTYAGSARLINAQPPPLVTTASAASIFATPTLVDSQLHTGEPSITVSPVVPADGSRPLIIGDAPWGTSNATSLWWRSRDGGESYELVQDPLAAPRPRPCEEIDGGGDSDTVIDKNGRIYVNDLAALINITVGVSADDFQTMSCSKAGGTNPLQPIQDRQWIAASPTADGEGPAIDAYVTFRRGLIGGSPVTETAIQIYASRDGGHTYEPVGEIVDFLGYANDKVTQTGNPVVDSTGGPYHGLLYQAYYLSNTAKVGRFDPVSETFETFTVAERFADIGNVFPTLAIDTAGNLYYAWVEGGSFDVLLSVSTNGAESWSDPVRLNAPGASELAVNPYAVAGSPGRVAVLFNGTEDAANPDGADGQSWHLWVAQSTNALDPAPSYTQYRVTDTPLHFNAICTRGLNCNLSVPEGDRSLLEFNEMEIDPLDGSLVFIFADNGRLPQPPLAADEIPQPYIMATRQIAGASMLAGKTVIDTLPRQSFAADRTGDGTYPKAGTAEGPNHPALDLRGSRLEATATGVRAVLTADDLSDLTAALAPEYGFGDPRLTQKASWVTRFEVEHTVLEDGQPVTREEVYALGMEYDLVAGGPTFWFGPVGVARNALLDVKRSNYSSADGTVTTGELGCHAISVEIPYDAMGLDLAVDPSPTFHSVVGFALAQPEGELDGVPVASYFNNQRTVDATRAYDWVLGEASGTPSTADAGPDRGVSVGESVSFDGSGSTPGSAEAIVCYHWEFGDGATAEGATASHSYAEAGVYEVTLTITDSLGFTSSDTATVTVGDDGTVVCGEIDDADPAVEYKGGWHRRSGGNAGGGSNGGYHRRMGSHNTGNGNGSTPVARVRFVGDAVTYHYVMSDRGGAADVYIDGELVDTVLYGANQPGPENPTFGHSRTWSALGPGTHELVIEHRYGAVYVDGFAFACEAGAGADPAGAAFASLTEVSTAQGALVQRTVEAGPATEEISVVVEGSAAPVTVRLLAPSGGLVASGGSLLGGAASGLDAAVSTPGSYTLEVVQAPGADDTLEVSIARTERLD